MKFSLCAFVVSAVLFLLTGGLPLDVHAIVPSASAGLILSWIGLRSRASGGDLIASVAGCYFVLVSLMSIPESVLFTYVKLSDAPLFMAEQLGAAIFAGVLVAVLLGKTAAAPLPDVRAFSAGGLLWRLIAGVAVFVICYVAAGALIFPLVKTYWQGKAMPDMGATLGLQVLRAVALMAAARLVVRGMTDRGQAELLLAVAFPVLGVLCLRFPNDSIPMMPMNIAVVHVGEVIPYFALCGFLYARWFGPVPAERRDQASA